MKSIKNYPGKLRRQGEIGAWQKELDTNGYAGNTALQCHKTVNDKVKKDGYSVIPVAGAGLS